VEDVEGEAVVVAVEAEAEAEVVEVEEEAFPGRLAEGEVFRGLRVGAGVFPGLPGDRAPPAEIFHVPLEAISRVLPEATFPGHPAETCSGPVEGACRREEDSVLPREIGLPWAVAQRSCLRWVEAADRGRLWGIVREEEQIVRRNFLRDLVAISPAWIVRVAVTEGSRIAHPNCHPSRARVVEASRTVLRNSPPVREVLAIVRVRDLGNGRVVGI
jgi:hypothetical protein